ncbi:MAG: hypothetical protein CL602_01555 [Alteromonas sp.]|uniref:Peptidase S26 domain-containing protein n=1 Tax=Alteromonas australica TaxID=589873 RepID=A0A358DZ34_9ALTE|nr:S26 family signal peptidase [Alteromonas australica]MBU32581.1 hypothetical protein [Alteromonas sp.]HBA58632.1 hypothetical protein [Alteromonas macleodii]HBU51478.1 hypothetical protein [Alteromonas australica]|tara:strand:- start:10562 stop:11062 length:501 start_codon:yes stop_codon:yes gene_type:complete
MSIDIENNFEVTPLKKTPWYALPIMLGVMAGIFYIGSNVKVVVTESVDAKVVWPLDRSPVVGDYVYFHLTHPVLETPDNTLPFVKVLTCTEGQLLQKDGMRWSCDGKDLGESREYSITGDKLDQFEFNGRIPKGKGFVQGTHKITFDSRYWGFVDINTVTTVQKVL